MMGRHARTLSRHPEWQVRYGYRTDRRVGRIIALQRARRAGRVHA